MNPSSFAAPPRLLIALALLLPLPAFVTPPAAGATFTVDTAVDEVDSSPGDGVCASASGDCSLRAAVMEANALPGPDEILIPGGPGIPAPSLSLMGAGEDASLTGDLDILDDLTVSGDGMALSGAEASGLFDRAIHVHPGVSLVLTGVSFFWSDAGAGQDGGGLLNEGIVTMVEASIQHARARSGAGILNLGELTLIHSVVGFNTASQAGGGIRNEGMLIIEQSTIGNNEVTGGPGGGIDNYGALDVRNTTISQSRATNGGAAIHNRAGGVVDLNNATVVYNQILPDVSGAPSTGGIFNEAGDSVEFSNTILAVNALGQSLPQADCMGAFVSAGHNLIFSLADCTLSGDTATNLVGADPMLPSLPVVDPAQTWGYPPLEGSPAIDAGNPAPPGSGGSACEAFDQRGQARPLGPACDIGAYEVESTGPTVTPTPTFTITTSPSATATEPSTPTATETTSPTATPTPAPALLFADDFESGDLSAWSSARTDQGDLGVAADAAIGGAFGLQAVLDDNRAIYVVDDTPGSETAYRARFYFDPNGITMASGNVHTIFLARAASGQTAFRLDFRSFQGDYQLRAATPVDDAAAAATVWVPLTDAPHWLEVAWWAASGEVTGDGGLLLWIDDERDPVAGFDGGLDNEARRVDQVRLGAVSGIDGGTRGTYFFDAFASSRGLPIGPDPSITLPPPPPLAELIFADGFESGDLSAWSATRNLTALAVSAPAALDGAFGLEVILDDIAPRYVVDWSPFAEARYAARFDFDPNGLAMSDGRAHQIFQTLIGGSRLVARIELRFKTGGYQLRAGAYDESGFWRNTAWAPIADRAHTLELVWRAAVEQPADGLLSLWIDGNPFESLNGIYNQGQQVDLVRLGAVAGVDAGTLGSMYFDRFESRR